MKMKYNVKIAKKQEREILISTDFIRLDAALKLSNAVTTGGEAKIIIQDGCVKVNGEVCLSRGKKLRENDSFEYEHIIYRIIK